MIIYGHRLFGKVDAVPGLGFVATRFLHIDYVPLVPTQGWLVFEQKGRTWRGIKIPVSFKSLLLAWSRLIAVVVAVGGLIAALVAYTGKFHPDMTEVGIDAAVGVGGLGVFVFLMKHKSVTRASYARAVELAKLAKMSDAWMLKLAEAYGQPPVSFGVQAIKPKPIGGVPAQPAAAIPLEEVEMINDGGPGETEPTPAPAAEPVLPVPPITAPLRAAPPLRGY